MILGLSYSIYSVLLYCTISSFVDDSMMGKAYGLSAVFLNFGTVIFPPMVGYIKENTERNHGYFWTEVSYIGFTILALIINIAQYLRTKQK